MACAMALGVAGASCAESTRPTARAAAAPMQATRARPVDRRFTTAFESYADEVAHLDQLLGGIETSETDDRIRRALRLLAGAMERIPRDDGDDAVVSLAVTQMHAAEVEGGLLGLQADGVVIDPAERVLTAASTAFLQLARGPYRADPRVLQASIRFKDAVTAIGKTSRLRPDRTPVVSALVEAAMVLRQMHHAAEHVGVP